MQEKICLHSCCAPCSSYCLLSLSPKSEIVVYYYNPNIGSEEEYKKRAGEQKRLIDELNAFSKLAGDPAAARERLAFMKQGCEKLEKHPQLWDWITERLLQERFPIFYEQGPYDPERFYEMAAGLEDEPERGVRCQGCYGLRLSETARFAKERGDISAFATTLTLSPLKDAKAINRIGGSIAQSVGISYLETDFKKQNGYLLSILLSELFGLYRQSYCGCIYSKEHQSERE
ncbi:MAG: epoxyqueuosine reductase QueH [Lachnospiraceae bacterium]|nr:epoxyqueuosine reductase QueH [Lachnospiraceae bacterium]